MKKLLAIVMMLLIPTVFIYAETVEEGVRKHPQSSLYYCKKKIWTQDIPPMSAIERIAINGQTKKAYIKFYNNDEEIEWDIERYKENRGITIYVLTGAEIGFDLEAEKIYYYKSNGKLVAYFEWDIKKTADAMRIQ